MNDWKEAIWLAVFELKSSIKGLLTLLIFLFVILLFFITAFPNYLEANFVGFDIFFLLTFSTAAIWAKPKEFQYQKIAEDIWANPFFVMLNQLPVKKSILMKSRFIIHFVYSIPFHIVLLVSLYFLTPIIKYEIGLNQYFVFSIIWICFGIAAGTIYPASDAGDKITNFGMVIYSFFLFIAFIIFFTLFQLFVGDGIVSWTLMVADKWPLLSIFISVIMAIASLYCWNNYLSKKIKKMDYLK